MAASLLIGGFIFGYAAWTIYRYIKRSQKGKCAGCSMEKSCGQSQCGSEEA